MAGALLRPAAWCLPLTRRVASERWYSTALFKMLDEAGIHPSSSDLIAAGRRAESSNPVLPGKTPDNHSTKQTED